jgi:O-antigen/teichoic acid export membrane protein
MTETRKFVKESAIYTIGEILSKSLAFILIPVYTRYLSKSDFGIYSVVITVWPILVILYGKGFGSYIMRGFYEIDKPEQKNQFFGSILIFSFLLSLVLAAIIHFMGEGIFSLLFREISYKPFLQFAVGIAIFKLFLNNVLTIYRAQRKPTTVVIISLLNFFSTTIIIIFLVVIMGKGLWGALGGQLLALILISIFIILYIRRDIYFTIQKKYVIAGILFMLPLIPHAIAGWVVNLSDRIFIERFCSLEDLAIYSLGYQLAMALEVLIISMTQAWLPFFYSNVSKSDQKKEIKKSAHFFFFAILTIGLLLCLFSQEIIFIAGKTEYISSARIFPLIIFAYIFYTIYFLSTAPILYAKKTYIFPLITISTGLINIGLNILLIPQMGYIAAAYSTIISYLFMAILSYLISLKYFEIAYQFFKMGGALFIAVLLYFSLFLFQNLSFEFQFILKIGLFIFFIALLNIFKIIPSKEIKTYIKLFLGKKGDLSEKLEKPEDNIITYKDDEI